MRSGSAPVSCAATQQLTRSTQYAASRPTRGRPPEAGHVGRAVRAVHTARRSAPRPQRGRAP
eukprot:scaffold18782_cov118-Isochrysis_galbana.AAC.5